MFRLYLSACALLASLLFTGCASHVPMSSAALLRPVEREVGFGIAAFRATTAERLNPTVTASACAFGSFPDPDCSSRPDRTVSADGPYNPNGIGAGLYLTTQSETVSVSATVGIPVAGVDVSVRVADPVVVTAAYSGGQRWSGGASFGQSIVDDLFGMATLEYRRRSLTYDDPSLRSDALYSFNPFTRYSNEINARISLLLLGKDVMQRTGVLFHASAGYDVTYSASTFGIGLAFGG